METQVKEVVAESVDVAMPTVVVTKFIDTQSGNQKGKNVQVKWITKKPGANSITSFFLGSMAQSYEQKRTALIFMANEVIESLKLDIGVNLNEALKTAGQPIVRLSISEISDVEYKEAEAQGIDTYGYQVKTTPDGEVMGYESAPIWRKTFVDVLDGKDEYLQSDGSVVEITADDITV